MGCVIDGARCTKCCEAITLRLNRKQLINHPGEDARFIRQHWKPISKRRAKKANSYLFTQFPDLRSSSHWHLYRCSALTAEGCGRYDARPPVCRDYPHYGRTGSEHEPEYHPQCSEWVKIAAVEVV